MLSNSRSAMRERPVWLTLLAWLTVLLYPLGAGWLLLNPDGWQINRMNVAVWYRLLAPWGLTTYVTPEQFADWMNLVLFVPFVWALWILKPTWLWVVIIVAVSAGVELYQWLISTRDATVTDVLTNTAGAILGALTGILTTHFLNRGPSKSFSVHAVYHDPNVQSTPAAFPTASEFDPGEPRGGRD